MSLVLSKLEKIKIPPLILKALEFKNQKEAKTQYKK